MSGGKLDWPETPCLLEGAKEATLKDKNMRKIIAASAFVIALTTACGSHDSVLAPATSRSVLELRDLAEASRSSMLPAQLEAIQAIADSIEDQMLRESYLQNFDAGASGLLNILLEKLSPEVSNYATSLRAGKKKAAETALEKAKECVKKITDYHVRIAMKAGYDSVSAQRMARHQAWIDYQTINPLVGGLRGRRPTTDEYARLREGPNKIVIDEGIDAWKQASLALFGRTGPLTQEDARTR